MSIDASTLRFFEDIRLEGSAGTWIEQHLRSELPRLTANAPWPSEPTGCLLADFGNYLVRLLYILTTLAADVLQSDLIESAEDGLHLANSLDNKHAALKQIANSLNNALKECTHAWSFTLSSQSVRFHEPALSESQHPTFRDPFIGSAGEATTSVSSTGYSVPAQQSSVNDLYTFEHDAIPSSAGPPPPEVFVQGDAQSSTSFGSIDNAQSPINNAKHVANAPLMEQLKSRGRGFYTCPRGYDCTKGGVLPNGELKVFERNSAFRAHLQLHERVYRCGLPGCPNQRGFARPDQLERHMKTVKHAAPGWVYEGPT